MRSPLIVANWKMNKTDLWARKFIPSFLPLVKEIKDREIALAPSFTSLITIHGLIENSGISLCAQNMHWELEGAYTGEISPKMLEEIGCRYVILGHSERREHFGDTDERIEKKLQTALSTGLVPILCVGEKEFERDSNRTFAVIERQIRKALGKIRLTNGEAAVIAYEPVWAIGTGRTATAEQAHEVHFFIRELLAQLANASIASAMRIIYGGSVTPDNIDSLMSSTEIDGALVGASSLVPEKFARIVNFSIERGK